MVRLPRWGRTAVRHGARHGVPWIAMAAVGTCALASCRPPPAELDALRYLAVGVEPRAEAAREERALESHGYRVLARVDGTHFVALGAASLGEERSAVRVITRRGVVLGVDAPSRDRPTWSRVDLVEAGSGRDLDGDENEELLLRVRDRLRPRPCLAVVRVDAEGAAYEVPIDTRAEGGDACAEGVGDVERDGRPELFVGHRPLRVEGAPVPVFEVPYTGVEGRFVPAPEATRTLHAREALATTTLLRDQARERGDTAEALALTIAIAFYAQASGTPTGVALRDLDADVESLAPDEPGRRLVASARALLLE